MNINYPIRKNERKIFVSNESKKLVSEPIACPYCGEKTVLATVLTTYTFKSEHTLFTDGVNMEGETMGQIIGEPSESFMHITSFRCTSCGKRWTATANEYNLVKDENGVCGFEKQAEKIKKRGKQNA